MKKNNLFKVLGVCFMAVVILTWLIPAGSFQGGEFVKGTTSPVGILDFVRIPLTTLSNYAGYALLILAIGGLYGVMNRTGVYSKFVSKVAKKFAKKEAKFAIITILFFTILSSVTGLSFVLFILVPFFAAVMLSLGYKKLPTMMATVGSILVGNIASTYGFNICGYLNYYLELDINNNIITKVIFFAILVGLLILYVLSSTKIRGKKEEKIDIPLLDDDNYEHKTHKTHLPMAIVLGFAVVLLMVACYNWSYAINFKGFEDLYENIIALKFNGYPLLKNIIGNFSPFGYWNTTEISIVLVMASAIIAWLYSLKLDDFFDSFKKGAKEVLPVAFYVALASVITSVILGSSTGSSIYYTIANEILKHAGKTFNVVVMLPLSLVSGLFVNEFPYFVNYMVGNVTTVFKQASAYPVLAFVMQSAHGILMLILPTSLILIAGLSYLKVSFKDWFKYVWKYAAQISVVSLIFYAILSLVF